MNELLATVVHRPYVFAFLTAYLFLAQRRWGWPRAILWLTTGYAIAWLSEYSSIHNGFPYGEYHYVYENLRGELQVAGVPFFDSLSYVFLTFAGWAMAEFILSGLGTRNSELGTSSSRPSESPIPNPGSRIFLGALLTTLLDVIVDPIATMGEKWFLGQIHFYAHPGWYFGVPLTNFAGWFLVSLAICGFNALAWRVFPMLFHERTNARTHECTAWLSPAFYACIALFSIVVTFWVGEWRLGLASSAILATILVATAFGGRSRI